MTSELAISPAPSPQQRAKALNAQLMAARHAYYVRSAPVMEDVDYDKLEQELKDLVAAHPEISKFASTLDTVGSDISGSYGVLKHRIPMQSLEKATTEAEVMAWCLDHPDNTTYDIEPKVDGCSLSVRYTDHKLWLGVTRGDGAEGEDVTHAALSIESIPKTLSQAFPPNLEIRGEVFITQGEFDRLNAEAAEAGKKPYANPRNLASGSLKLSDPREVLKRKLAFQPWQVIGMEPGAQQANPEGIESSEAMEFLWRMAPVTRQPLGHRAYSKAELLPLIERLRVEREVLWADGLGMQTDGIVIKVHEDAIRKRLGVGGRTPPWALAYKYPQRQSVTTLREIQWQVGRTGKLTPVAILDPVDVGGAIVSRSILNNQTWLTEMGIHLPCTVEITRGGDVIPKVTSVISKPHDAQVPRAPTACPACGHGVMEGITSSALSHTCTNLECPGRLKAHLIYMGKREVLDIEGLGDVLVERFVDEGVIYSLGSLFSWGAEAEPQIGTEAFDADCEAAGFGVAQVETLCRGLSKSKAASWDRWLQALGIPDIAKESAKAIAAFLILQPDDLPNLHVRLGSITEGAIYGIGPERIASMRDWCADPAVAADLQLLYDMGVRPACTVVMDDTPQPLTGFVICITGEFNLDRSIIQEHLTRLGATCKSSVVKNCNLLLVGESAGKSKLAKAQAQNVRQEGREWLAATLKPLGVDLNASGWGSHGEADMDDL